MKAPVLRLASITAMLGMMSLPVYAQNPHDPHPTLTAAHRFAHRKVAHAAYAAHHVRRHVHHWEHRKAHNVRAWLNSH